MANNPTNINKTNNYLSPQIMYVTTIYQQKLQFDSSLTKSVDQQITDHALKFTDNSQMKQL